MLTHRASGSYQPDFSFIFVSVLLNFKENCRDIQKSLWEKWSDHQLYNFIYLATHYTVSLRERSAECFFGCFRSLLLFIFEGTEGLTSRVTLNVCILQPVLKSPRNKNSVFSLFFKSDMCCSYPCLYDNIWPNNDQKAVLQFWSLKLIVIKYWWLILHSGHILVLHSIKFFREYSPPII